MAIFNWFNNRFNDDNTIHFDRNEWMCTDEDNFQYCRKVNDTTFEYIQLKDLELIRDSLCTRLRALDYLNDETGVDDWYQDEIDVMRYDDETIREYLAPFSGILDGVEDLIERNQLIAECIFETDCIANNI